MALFQTKFRMTIQIAFEIKFTDIAPSVKNEMKYQKILKAKTVIQVFSNILKCAWIATVPIVMTSANILHVNEI